MSRTIWEAWSFSLPIGGAMLGCLCAYFVLWRRKQAKLSWLLSFMGGILALVLAFFSPIDSVGGCCLLSVHMLQHMLLLSGGPALLIWGLCGIIPRRMQRVGVPLPWPARPIVVLPLFIANLYLWHIPAAYQLALQSRPVHDLEHMGYLVTGALFWWGVINPLSADPIIPSNIGRRLGYLLAGSLSMMPLGLFLSWLGHPLYTFYETAAHAMNSTAVFDQQYAALVMLGSGGLFLSIALLVALRALDGRQERSTQAG